jgi:hypothetical protein
MDSATAPPPIVTISTPTSNPYDFSRSNFILMVGGQILFLLLLLAVVVFGVPPTSFPANAVRNMLARSKGAFLRK